MRKREPKPIPLKDPFPALGSGIDWASVAQALELQRLENEELVKYVTAQGEGYYRISHGIFYCR